MSNAWQLALGNNVPLTIFAPPVQLHLTSTVYFRLDGGLNGYVLTTDGQGRLYWTPGGGGGGIPPPTPSGGSAVLADPSVWLLDGVNRAFLLVDITGASIIPVSAADCLVSLDGVPQHPTIDFTVNADTLTFTIAPRADATLWIVVNLLIPGGGGGGPVIADNASIVGDGTAPSPLRVDVIDCGAYTVFTRSVPKRITRDVPDRPGPAHDDEQRARAAPARRVQRRDWPGDQTVAWRRRRW